MSSWSWRAGLAGAAILAASAYALAQMAPEHRGMHGMGPGGEGPRGAMMHEQMQGHGMHGSMGSHAMTAKGQPILPGQDAFGAIQEIVQILQDDPATDWSKVSIAALREHLIDMNEVTLRAKTSEHALDNGVEIIVTGQDRTAAAIKRMVPAHAGELEKLGWSAKTEDLPDGVKLTVTSSDAKQAVKLRALGFMGIMVQGAHHQTHHLMMAKGELSGHVH
jgi:hypothetical protein